MEVNPVISIFNLFYFREVLTLYIFKLHFVYLPLYFVVLDLGL